MSSRGADETDDGRVTPAPVEKALRTVTPSFRGRPDAEMTTIGIAYGLGLVVLLIPLLPFIVVVWVVSKITGFLARKAPTNRVP
ncbi:DUF7535 family protein [Halorussus pelagicus]|uniref:DUF7535 family protein n=1 Tax=Halorussus pelagicus TaxID=2505977 RepID=UPI000FFCA6B0|nr:hypothetical protein [Halorussus pelagicus]